MRRVLVVAALVPVLLGLYLLGDWWIGIPEGRQASYVGRESCIRCHAAQHDAWQDSDHDRAMDLATDETVLGDFNDQEFEYHGITSRFFRDGKKFLVTTDGPDGKMGTFEVKYTFGVRPLQQYMVEMEGGRGRVQVLPFAWDGVQGRWFHVYQDERQVIRAGDPIHWTGPGGNWNHTCAECHSTDLRKNYDLAKDEFHTQYAEIDVSCEACHGPGSLHVELATAWSPFWDRRLDYGLHKMKGQANTAEIETCARCHAHRALVAEGFHAGHAFLDHYVPALLDTGIYFEDGQLLEEAYEYGSFLQSLMYRKNVKCSDCHDPHSTRIRVQGNNLCLRCHPSKYDTEAHIRHPRGRPGSQCVDCHMPTRNYMVVDPRRDHSLRPPRPDLSVLLGTPNSCTGCHLTMPSPRIGPALSPESEALYEKYKSYAAWEEAARRGDTAARETLTLFDRWAAEKVVAWHGPKRRDERHFALALAAGLRGELEEGAKDRDDPRAAADEIVRRLGELSRRDAGPVVRASAVSLLVNYPSDEARRASEEALKDKEPLVRLAAVRNLANFSAIDPVDIWSFDELDSAAREEMDRRRLRLAKQAAPLLSDPVRVVRMEAARVLAIVPSTYFTRAEWEQWKFAMDEYEKGQLANADTAAAHVNLAQIYARQGRLEDAERAYRTAMKVQPSFIPARTSLAAIYNYQRRNDEAEKLLREAAEIYPQGADIHYNLALLLAESEGRLAEAAEAAGKAVALAPRHARMRYNYGLMLERLSRYDEAEEQLREARRLDSRSTETLYALVILLRGRQKWREALPLAEELARVAGGDPTVLAMLAEIRRKAM
jgi:predicted CXXCH cytochrome family protein